VEKGKEMSKEKEQKDKIEEHAIEQEASKSEDETQETQSETQTNKVEKNKGGRPKKSGQAIENPLIAEAAFWYYVSLGEKRSLDKVAEHFDLDIWVVKEMSRQNKWAEKIKEFASSDAFIGSDIIKHIDSIRMAVLTSIVENPKSSAKEKMAALRELTEFIKQSNDLVQKKKIIIEFPHREELQRIVNGLRDGTAYKDVLGKAGYSVPVPPDYIDNKR
jgi:hypothetical protein